MSESVAEGGGVSTEKWRWTFATKHVRELCPPLIPPHSSYLGQKAPKSRTHSHEHGVKVVILGLHREIARWRKVGL